MRSATSLLIVVAMAFALASVITATPVSKPKARLVTLTRTMTVTRTIVTTPTATLTRTSTAYSGCTAAPKKRTTKQKHNNKRNADAAEVVDKEAKLFFSKGKPLAVGTAPKAKSEQELEKRDESLEKRGIVWRIVANTITRTSVAPTRTATAIVTTTVCTGKAAPTQQPATTTTVVVPASTTSVTAATNAAIVTDQLALHNAKRALHYTGTQTTPSMGWNDTLSQYALNYAVQCNSGHSNGPYGENLAWGAPPNAWSDEELFQLWYDEEQGYDYTDNYFAEATGHFTQVVWKASSQLGCAVVTCPGSDAMFGKSVPFKSLTCEYSNQRGNWQGQFVANVLPPAVAGT